MNTIRIQKTPDVTADAEVRVIITTDDKVIEAKLPLYSFAHAVMGVAGIDCEVDIRNRNV